MSQIRVRKGLKFDAYTTKQLLQIEIHELQRTANGELDRFLPYPHQRGVGTTGALGSVAHVRADGETVYGMTITSDCMEPLHVWAFYFDCSDLSISTYVDPATLESKAADGTQRITIIRRLTARIRMANLLFPAEISYMLAR